MAGDILLFLIQISFTIMGAAFLARAWLHSIRFHPFNPFAQLIYRVTEWLCKPLRAVLPTARSIDYASLVGVYLVALFYLIFVWVLATRGLPPSQIWLPGLIAAGVRVGLWALNLVIWLTLIQAILSWVNPLAPIMPVLRTLTDPLLAPIRRILPNLGGFDLSPLVLLIFAQIALMVMSRISFTLIGL
jgi:YggT family protein